jgi:hypothetical protein
MTATTLSSITDFLLEIGTPAAFTARQTATAEDLDLEVKGVGKIRFPISPTRAKRLCKLARPARYGRGEQTLLDRQVRDTWEIPKSRVKIDKRRWNRTLLPVLEALRADLGLPESCRLKAELHSMLVYAPGQFFLPHQDSEKADEMVGTLVVTLPSPFKGGAMVIAHQGEKVSYRASKKPLSFIAFYADCLHEVRPVKEGYRIVLTYNLVLAEGSVGGVLAETEPAVAEALAAHLREHFETPLPAYQHWRQDTAEPPPRDPPDRLVYLLDHQYTQRGLRWSHLKGNDAVRAEALRAAAGHYDCELVLALAEVHETWTCFEPGWDEPYYGRRRSWERDDDDDWYEDEPVATGPDAYDLGELVDSDLTLSHWTTPAGKKASALATAVDGDEVCATTPTSELEAHSSEYEGYMGNYGNTMDRWYRRAAVVLWPRRNAFLVRAEASPAWALDTLRKRIRAGKVDEAQRMAASLQGFWNGVAPHEPRSGFFDKVLQVADGLDSPELATALLQPFRVEALTTGNAADWVALVKRYGKRWVQALLADWSGSRQLWRRADDRSPAWFKALPRLCKALLAADKSAGSLSGRLLLQDRWDWLREEAQEALGTRQPTSRAKELAALSTPILGLLEGAAVVKAPALRDEAVAFLCDDSKADLLPCLVKVLRTAAKQKGARAKAAAIGLESIRRHCTRRLKARLRQPARAESDWSLTLPNDCDCELCDTLSSFLSDPTAERLDWPLAKDGRQHVHRSIDAAELPVSHQTRRSGRPYTLVLTKQKILFERAARERKSWEQELEWLEASG